MVRLLNLVLVASLLAAGCISDGDSDDAALSAGNVTIGIYDLVVEPVVDTCMPTRLTGEYRGAIRQGAPEYGGVSIFVPERARGDAVLLRPFEFDANLLHPDFGLPVDDCLTGGRARSMTVTSANAEVIEMTVVDDWNNLVRCREGGSAPIGDCHTERQLTFTLVEACPPPCAAVAGETLMCDCESQCNIEQAEFVKMVLDACFESNAAIDKLCQSPPQDLQACAAALPSAGCPSATISECEALLE